MLGSVVAAMGEGAPGSALGPPESSPSVGAAGLAGGCGGLPSSKSMRSLAPPATRLPVPASLSAISRDTAAARGSVSGCGCGVELVGLSPVASVTWFLSSAALGTLFGWKLEAWPAVSTGCFGDDMQAWLWRDGELNVDRFES